MYKNQYLLFVSLLYNPYSSNILKYTMCRSDLKSLEYILYKTVVVQLC